MKDMNGVTLYLGARVKTLTGKIAFVVSLHPNSGEIRIRYAPAGLIRKISAEQVERC